MHMPGLVVAPATGTHAIQTIPVATDRAGLLLAAFKVAFKTSLELNSQPEHANTCT